MLSADEDTFRRDLATQIYRNASIAETKFRFMRFSMGLLFTAVPSWLVTIAFLYAS